MAALRAGEISVSDATTPPTPEPSPIRVQLRRTKGWKMPPNTVKVDRSTDFGNPFPVTKCKSTSMGITTDTWCVGTWNGPAMWFRDTKAEALDLSILAFRSYCPPESTLALAARRLLRGKNLGCWCALDAPCHADVLLELANSSPSAGRLVASRVDGDKSRDDHQ